MGDSNPDTLYIFELYLEDKFRDAELLKAHVL